MNKLVLNLAIGFAMSTFLGSKQKVNSNKLKLPSFKGVVEVKAAIPGRIRLYIPMLKDNEEAASQLALQFDKVKVINTMQINTLTATVLVAYDEKNITPEILQGALIKMLGLEAELHKKEQTLVEKELKNIKDALNLAVSDKTRGIIDLKYTLFLVIMGVGIFDLFKRPQIGPAGYTCLWWASRMLPR